MTNKLKTKFELFSTKTGEKVTGYIITTNTAKVVFEDKTSEILYLTYIPVEDNEEDLVGLDDNPMYLFSIMNFIHEGYVPYGHMRIVGDNYPTKTLVEAINSVLSKTNYSWSAKDQVSTTKVPVKTKINGYWTNSTQLVVLVNGLNFGSVIM